MGKKKCKKTECPPAEKWAVPFADFLSLLLALFIALYALSSVNKEKIKAVKEEFVKIYDYAPVPESFQPVIDMTSEEKPTPDAISNPSGEMPIQKGGAVLQGSPSTSEATSDAVTKIMQDLKNASMGEGPLDQAMDGVLLKLPATILFRGSSSTIDDEEMHLFIKRIADIINALPPTVDISVRGYTDDLPVPAGAGIRDNMELSSRRADTVVRELIQDGVTPQRLSTAGFGPAKPVAPNTSEANRAKNRRVEFYIFVSNEVPMDANRQQNILDVLGKLQK